MKILVDDEIERFSWDSLLNHSQFSSPFQTPAYYSAIKGAGNSDSIVIALSTGSALKALVVVTLLRDAGIKGYFSRRGILFGGPVLFNISSDELSFFLKEVGLILSEKVIYLEIRNFFDYSNYDRIFLSSGLAYIPYLNFQLNLSKVHRDNVLSLFKYNRRREIKQSLSKGAIYGECDSEKEIKEIYLILSKLYETKVKLPLPSFEYFLKLKDNEILKCFFVRHNGNVIGGSFCPLLPGKNIYTYYYCGLKHYHKQIFPTHLAVLAAIEYAIINNIPLFDFMGAGQPGISYGVRTYKSEFGGTLVEHGRYLKILNPFLYTVGKAGLRFISLLS